MADLTSSQQMWPPVAVIQMMKTLLRRWCTPQCFQAGAGVWPRTRLLQVRVRTSVVFGWFLPWFSYLTWCSFSFPLCGNWMIFSSAVPFRNTSFVTGKLSQVHVIKIMSLISLLKISISASGLHFLMIFEDKRSLSFILLIFLSVKNTCCM